MTGDISARRGALPIKSTPPDHSEMVNGFELFKGVAGDTLKKKPRRWGQSTGANGEGKRARGQSGGSGKTASSI